MFKTSVILGLLSLALTGALLTSPSTVLAYVFNNQLDIGDRGEDVSALQQTLTNLNHFAYPTITGYFGPITQTAVQAFQAARGIVSSGTPESTGYGRVGPQTLAELNGVQGSSGAAATLNALLEQLKVLQARLAELRGDTDVATNSALGAPANLKASQRSNEVTLTWEEVSDATSYLLKRKKYEGSYQTLATTTDTTYIDGDVSRANRYYYIVTAVNDDGEGVASESAYVYISGSGGGGGSDTTAPGLPTGLSVTGGDATSTVTWNDPADGDLDLISIYRGTTSGSLSLVATINAGIETYNDSPLTNDTTYYYALTATDSAGNTSATTSEVSEFVGPWVFASGTWSDGGYWRDDSSWNRFAPTSTPSLYLSSVSAGSGKNTTESEFAAVIDRYFGYTENTNLSTYGEVRTKLNTIASAFGVSTIDNHDTGSTTRNKLNAIIDAQNPTFVFDTSDNFYYWGDEEKQLSDATDNGDGSYTINDGSWWNDSWTMVAEYEPVDGTTPSGNIFSWTNGSLQRLELLPTNDESTRIFYSPDGDYGSFYYGGIIVGDNSAGRRRITAAIEEGSAVRGKVDANDPTDLNSKTLVGDFSAPTKVGIQRRERFEDSVLSNGELHRVAAWPRKLTDEQLHAVNVAGAYPPVHLLGDSYLNSGITTQQEQILLLTSAEDEHIAFSQDGVGGTSLTMQSERFALTPQFYPSTLIIIDAGGEEDEADRLAALQDIVGHLGHDRWYIIEPQSGDYDAVRNYAGDHMIPTKDAMQAENDGSPEDMEDIANDLWPRSLRSDNIHLNADGKAVLAEIIYSYLKADGLMP